MVTFEPYTGMSNTLNLLLAMFKLLLNLRRGERRGWRGGVRGGMERRGERRGAEEEVRSLGQFTIHSCPYTHLSCKSPRG